MSSALVVMPPLATGMQMTREEFIRRWEQMPELKCAELIDGVVFVASPLGSDHGSLDFTVHTWLGMYVAETPGCDGGANSTWYMLNSAPQPDAWLRISPRAGGQSRDIKNFSYGAPELAVEVSDSTMGVDFGPKLALYQRAGVQEYISVRTYPPKVVWRVLSDGAYVEIAPEKDGVYRSRVFPGLWLDWKALYDGDAKKMLAVLRKGLRTKEHAVFANKLAKKL
jgi:Uma2 family endonuclease